jgi:N-acetylmuramoyl-L-alanine amidase CwlA
MCVKSKTGKAPKYPNDPAWYFTDATVAACVKLTKYLMKLYGIDRTHVIRHFDVNGKYCPGVVGWNGPSGSDADWLAFKDLLAGVTPTPTPTPTPGKNYRVRVGIFQKEYYLNRLKMRIKNKTGLDCFTEQKSDGTHIYCGSFSNKANADARAQLLRNAGFDTAIEEA